MSPKELQLRRRAALFIATPPNAAALSPWAPRLVGGFDPCRHGHSCQSFCSSVKTNDRSI